MGSVAQLFLRRKSKFSAEFNPQASPGIHAGTLVAVVTFDTNVGRNPCDIFCIRAYLCYISQVLNLESFKGNTNVEERDNEIFLRYNNTVHVPLTGDIEKEKVISVGKKDTTVKDVIEESIINLKSALGNYDNVERLYYITDTNPETKTDVYNHLFGSKEQTKKFNFIALSEKLVKDSFDEVRGCVLKISKACPHHTKIQSPLLSLTLTLCPEKGDTENDEIVVTPLFQKCIKRQLVGSLVLFQKGCNEDFDVSHHDAKYRRLRNTFHSVFDRCASPLSSNQMIGSKYVVTEVIPMCKRSSASQNKSLCSLYQVIPSTRITILVEEESKDNRNANNHRILDEVRWESISPTTLVLNVIETIQYSFLSQWKDKNSHPLPDIPRAYLLSGPPGVGRLTPYLLEL